MKTKFKQFTDISKITHHPKITKNNKKTTIYSRNPGPGPRACGGVKSVNVSPFLIISYHYS